MSHNVCAPSASYEDGSQNRCISTVQLFEMGKCQTYLTVNTQRGSRGFWIRDSWENLEEHEKETPSGSF